MVLNRVTFTGADDSVDPNDLLALSREYPFIEWGVLFSQKWQGSARYPSLGWLRRLSKANLQGGLPIAAHLCGQWVRDLVLDGNFSWKRTTYSWLWSDISRFQLNFRGQFQQSHPDFRDAIVHHAEVFGKSFILQCDGPQDAAVRALVDATVFPEGFCRASGECVCPLFDRSGGKGLTPLVWPDAWPGVYCGYAGGLGPDTIADQLTAIEAAAPTATIWVDMERHVRSADDTVFDLTKVRRVLDVVSARVS